MWYVVGLYEDADLEIPRGAPRRQTWLVRAGPYGTLEMAGFAKRRVLAAGPVTLDGLRWALVDAHICKQKDLRSYGMNRRSLHVWQVLLPGLEVEE